MPMIFFYIYIFKVFSALKGIYHMLSFQPERPVGHVRLPAVLPARRGALVQKGDIVRTNRLMVPQGADGCGCREVAKQGQRASWFSKTETEPQSLRLSGPSCYL